MTTDCHVFAKLRSKYRIHISVSQAPQNTIGHATQTKSPIARVCRMAGSRTSEKLFWGRPGASQLMGGGGILYPRRRRSPVVDRRCRPPRSQLSCSLPSALTKIPNDSPTKQPLAHRTNDLHLRRALLGHQRSLTQSLTEAGFVGFWYPSLS